MYKSGDSNAQKALEKFGRYNSEEEKPEPTITVTKSQLQKMIDDAVATALRKQVI